MDRELVQLKVVQGRLGISKTKMAELVRTGRFPVYENPLDRRQKLVDWSEVQAALRDVKLLRQQSENEGKAAA